MFLFLKYPRIFQKLSVLLWYITRGMRLHRKNRIDVIVTYGSNLPAVAGTALKWLTGAKLIVEIPGAPENSFRYDEPDPGVKASVKHSAADLLLWFVGLACDCLKLFYPWQLNEYPSLQRKPKAVFHDFVPVRCVPLTEETDERYILCVGYPWYTKGMDILIGAFRRIAAQYPDVRLRLMGYLPDPRVLEELAEGSPQIEFLGARPNEEALKIIDACTIYILASRTEALPWVLLEAMAGQRAIIASKVGGVPFCIADGENGLLFRPGNVDELAEKMVQLLNDKPLRERLGQRGRERVMSEFDELAYARHFQEMLKSVQPELDRSSNVKSGQIKPLPGNQ
jgi:glycosyltransferase involved in cell wall biosynthesis